MSTMCFDIRRVDDDHVCIFKAAHNAFSYSYHIPDSSINTQDEDDVNDKYVYHYVIVAKSKTNEGIEHIVFSCRSKAHIHSVYERFLTGDCLYANDFYDYRIMRLPIYEYRHFTRNGKRTYKLGDKTFRFTFQKINTLHSEFTLYCPISLNKKYRVYGTYLNKKKVKGGYKWKGPRRIKTKR